MRFTAAAYLLLKHATMLQVMKNLRWVLGVLLLTTACKKSPLPVIPNEPAKPVAAMTRLEKDGDSWLTYYNEDGTIRQLIRKLADSSVFNNFDFVYANSKLQEVNSTGKWKYYYTGDLISAIETFNNRGELRYRTEFTYANGKMLERTGYFANVNVPLKPDSRILFTYTADGNIAKKSFFDYVNDAWMKTEELHIVAYDNHPNIGEHLENFPYLPLGYYSVNNPVKEIYLTTQGQAYGTVEHAYAYNTADKPVERKSKYSYLGFPDTYSVVKFHF